MMKTLKLLSMNPNHRFFVSLTAGMVLAMALFAAGAVKAYHPDNPSIDDGFEHSVLGLCPGSNTAPGQTLHVLYFSPSTLPNNGSGSGSTNIYATSVMCTNSNYNQVRNIRIFTTGTVNRTAGTGNVSLSQNFYPPNIGINQYERFAGPVSGTANFSNLSDGWNCWDVEYDATAQYGGSTSNITGTGWMNLCVYYSPPQPSNYPYTIQGFRTYGPGPGGGFPDGVGATQICGNSYNNNPYIITGLTGACVISSDATISYGGVVYDRVGYTMCYDRTDCHGAARDPGGSVTVNLAGPTQGRYVDIWWHYAPRDNPPSISVTPDCGSRTVRVIVNDSDPGTALVGYNIDGGGEIWVSSNDFTIDMSGQDQYDPHTVSARTQGVAPASASPGGFVSANTLYGISATRGCLDRSFVATPDPDAPTLSPNEEEPTSASFTSRVTATITPGSPNGVTLTVTREYYIRRGASVIPLTPAPSPSPDTRSFNGTYTYPTDTVNLAGIVQVGDRVCVSVAVTPGAGTVDRDGNVLSVTDGSNEAEECTTIMYRPYFRVYGGDIVAGISASCAGWTGGAPGAEITGATILGYNSGGTPNWRGAGAELAAQAAGFLNGFVSAARRTSAPSPPIGLTFANTSGAYGGSFGGAPCPTDYFAAGAATAVGSNSLTGIMGSTSGITGEQKIYVNGNLTINQDVTYGGWASISDIPRLYVVVKGNIYIQPNVSRIDGVFIAQPNAAANSVTVANQGMIYTCADGTTSPPNSSNGWSGTGGSGCGRDLIVNGSLVALAIRPFRTNGTVSRGNPTEFPNNNIAESFQYSPEVWLAPCAVGNCDEPSVDAYTTLPPLL